MARLLRTALKGLVPSDRIREIETGIDTIGDIAVIKLGASIIEREIIGEAILKNVKSVRAVFNQEGGVEGEFRLRKLTHLAGEKKTVTLHKENGCRFKVDVASCYFSPRLSTERLRIANMVNDGEIVLNMFAGVGPYSILIAKRKAIVYSCELNQVAYNFHVENNELNKVTKNIHMINADALNLPSLLELKFDRVLMPHPFKAHRYLTPARKLTKDNGVIHYYRHITAKNGDYAEMIMREEVRSILGEEPEVSVRKVKEIGPRYLEMVADISFYHSNNLERQLLAVSI